MEIVKLENILAKVECSSWEEAIISAGELLIKSGYVTEKYVDEMVEAVKQLGPYIVMVPHVALAHARPGDSVLMEGISVITLKEPLDFGSEYNDPVKIVIAFSATDAGKHLKAIQDISKILENDEKLEMIFNASDSKIIYNIINDID
ncbi:MAG: PTS sugar transporter subunit IIA [Alkaliphilus sp.]|nr:PTS sugar transporter subunit IIA [Alkaliphilus sp.]